MAIDAVQGITAWSGMKHDRNSREKTEAAKDTFAKMLRQLETGGGISDTGESNGEDTTTVTQIMSDGSVLVTVYAGNRIVSQSKTHAANPQENPAIVSTRVEHSAPPLTGNTVGDELAANMAAAQMLAMLMQK